jgi:hypothetical protein
MSTESPAWIRVMRTHSHGQRDNHAPGVAEPVEEMRERMGHTGVDQHSIADARVEAGAIGGMNRDLRPVRKVLVGAGG